MLGQAFPVTNGGYDWDVNCIDPNNTAPYSAPFGAFLLETPFWSGGVGLFGTVAYAKCPLDTDAKGGNVNVSGRFGFANGPLGSIQDDFRLYYNDTDVVMDNGATFLYAMNTLTDPWFDGTFNPLTTPGSGTTPNTPWTLDTGVLAATSGSDWSFADIVTQSKAGAALNQTAYGANGLYEYFEGSSNRYAYRREASGNNVDTLLVMDVLGDTSRLTWQLTNTGTATQNIGLYFSQWPYIVGGYANNDYGSIAGPFTPSFGDGEAFYMGWTTPDDTLQTYAFLPGQKALRLETRYIRSQNPSTFPAYVTFTGGLFGGDTVQQRPNTGPGYMIVNSPIPEVEDQNGQSDMTPVDEIVFGDPINTLNGDFNYGVTNPKVKDILVPDSEPLLLTFTQKWYPTPVQAGASQTIIAYYKSIWADSNYASGYTALVDTPKALSVSATNPNQFDYPSGENGSNAIPGLTVPYWPIMVSVDNTGAFGQVYKEFNMTNVQVTLQLSQGLYDAANPSNQTLTNYINSIPSKGIGYTIFYVTADPHVQGNVQYTVTITPNPGVQKQITGYINFGATANIYMATGANLVGVPYTFPAPTWDQILGLTPQTQNQVQEYNWDPTLGDYTISTGPTRGQGTWLVSNLASSFVALGATNGDTPAEPTDEFPPSTGAPPITLQPGWNLVANPYNYAFQLGQLNGVAANSSTVYTYDQLVSQNILQGSFAYYDPNQQSYAYIQADTDYMYPNYGYWIYANQALTIGFPPIYSLFLRTADVTPPFLQRYNNWHLQLSARQSRSQDLNNFIGFTTNTTNPAALRSLKAPISPAPGAMRAYVTSSGTSGGSGTGKGISTGQYANLMHTSFGKQTFNFNVFTQSVGATKITWPNLSAIPSNISVAIEDTHTGKTINARSVNNYSYYAQANSIRTFAITTTPMGTEREAITNVTTSVRRVGSTLQMPMSFDATVRGSANITIYKGSQQVGTIVTNMTVDSGKNSLTWPMILSNGQLAPAGNYTLSIQATGEGGDTTTKLVNITL